MTPTRWFGNFVLRNGPALGAFLLVAVGFWIFVMILAPQVAMVDFSFRHNLTPPSRAVRRTSTPSSTTSSWSTAAPRPPAPSTPST